MAYLITHSLLSSWLHAIKANPYEDLTTERDPMEEFMLTLKREPTPVSEAMEAGIAFEDTVTNILHGLDESQSAWYDGAARVAHRCEGGVLQFRAKKRIEVNGMQFLLYGRLDCLKAGEVIDIKFTKNYDPGKYFDSTQHPVYLELIPEAEKFTYLVSNGMAVWQEAYRRDETRDIKPYISDFIDWLKAVDLFDLYAKHWEDKKC